MKTIGESFEEEKLSKTHKLFYQEEGTDDEKVIVSDGDILQIMNLKTLKPGN